MLPALHIIEANTICLLGRATKSGALSHQVASRKGTSLLALGRLCTRCEPSVRVGFEPESQAQRTEGFLAYEAEVVYRD
jgi:hypothetical protein